MLLLVLAKGEVDLDAEKNALIEETERKLEEAVYNFKVSDDEFVE